MFLPLIFTLETIINCEILALLGFACFLQGSAEALASLSLLLPSAKSTSQSFWQD